MVFFLLAALACASCGPGHPDVWLSLGQDGTQPCLGAAHLEIEVSTPKGKSVFHEFNQFFDANTHSCAIGQFRYPDLPLGNGAEIAVSVWDSTSDTAGQLATGSSLPLNINDDSPTTQVDITLSRLQVPLGTMIIQRPSDWGSVGGISSLMYRVIPAGEQIPVRSGYLAYAPELRPDPFPLIISSLPLPQELSEMTIYVEAYREGEPNALRTWTSSAWLGGGTNQNPAYVNFN